MACDCGATCYASCMYACDGCSGCSGCSGCKDTCKSACNKTCSGQTQTTNINKLSLDPEFIKASDLSNIITAINFEISDRRSGTPTHSISVSADIAMDDALMNKIKENLSQTGQTASYSASADAMITMAIFDDFITKVKAANNAQINLP